MQNTIIIANDATLNLPFAVTIIKLTSTIATRAIIEDQSVSSSTPMAACCLSSEAGRWPPVNAAGLSWFPQAA